MSRPLETHILLLSFLVDEKLNCFTNMCKISLWRQILEAPSLLSPLSVPVAPNYEKKTKKQKNPI